MGLEGRSWAFEFEGVPNLKIGYGPESRAAACRAHIGLHTPIHRDVSCQTAALNQMGIHLRFHDAYTPRTHEHALPPRHLYTFIINVYRHRQIPTATSTSRNQSFGLQHSTKASSPTISDTAVHLQPAHYEGADSHISRLSNFRADQKTQPHSSRIFGARLHLASSWPGLALAHRLSHHWLPLLSLLLLPRETSLLLVLIALSYSFLSSTRNHSQLYNAIVSRTFKHLKDCIQREFNRQFEFALELTLSLLRSVIARSGIFAFPSCSWRSTCHCNQPADSLTRALPSNKFSLCQ